MKIKSHILLITLVAVISIGVTILIIDIHENKLDSHIEKSTTEQSNETKEINETREFEYESATNKELRLQYKIEPEQDTALTHLGKEFTVALYGKYNMLHFPSIKIEEVFNGTIGEDGKEAITHYGYLDVTPISSNYISYTYDSKKSLTEAARYVGEVGRDLISNYSDDILELADKTSSEIKIQDCYLGYPLYMANSNEEYRVCFPVLAAYEKSGIYKIALLGVIGDSTLLEIDEESLQEFNSTNKLIDSTYTGMEEWSLKLNKEDNKLYLENLGIVNNDNSLKIDITYPLCGSTLNDIN